MQFLLSLCVGVLLVAGQSLWKLAITKSMGGTGNFSLVLRSPMRVLLAPAFITGCIIYAVATLLYMYVISKYNYGVSYALIVACSTILTSILATMLFKEEFRLINGFGLAFIIVGITLVTRK